MYLELHVLAILLYSLTAVSVTMPLVGLKSGPLSRRAMLLLAAVAVMVHFAAQVAYVRASGSFPFTGTASALSSLAFMVALLALCIHAFSGESAIQLIAAPLTIVLVGIALVIGFGPSTLGTGDRGTPFVFHASASLLGLAFLAAAFAASLLYLAMHRELKGKSFGTIFQMFPSLEQLDRLNLITLAAGFVILSLGVFLGATSAGGQVARMGEFITQDTPHFVWGVASWLVLGGVAVARLAGTLKGKPAAYASIGSFSLVLLSFFLILGIGGMGSV